MGTKPLYIKFELTDHEDVYKIQTCIIEEFMEMCVGISGKLPRFVEVMEDPIPSVIEDMLSVYESGDKKVDDYLKSCKMFISEELCENNDFINREMFECKVSEHIENCVWCRKVIL